MPLQKLISSKWLILVELGVAIFLVLAHNIFHILPLSETPFIFILVLVCFKLHGAGWKSIGFRRPVSWKTVIIVGMISGMALQLLSTFITEPFIAYLTGEKPDIEQFNEINGNTTMLFLYLALVWTVAAFGEEIAYRGFIANKFASLFGSTDKALWVGILISSILFGIGHFYQGMAGMINSGISGIIFGGIYVLSGRNLWFSIFTHGFTDTYGIFYFYFGYYQ